MEGIMIAHGLIRINKTTAIPLSSILRISGPYDKWSDDGGEEYDKPGKGREPFRYVMVEYIMPNYSSGHTVNEAYMDLDVYERLFGVPAQPATTGAREVGW